MKRFIILSFFTLMGTVSYAQIPADTTSKPVTSGQTENYVRPVVAPEEDLFLKGEIDASRHYKKHKAASGGTFALSFISPLLGLIPAIACSATSPKVENLGYPDQQLFLKREYAAGYTHKAKKMKKGKVWRNWALGLGANLIFVLITSAK